MGRRLVGCRSGLPRNRRRAPDCPKWTARKLVNSGIVWLIKVELSRCQKYVPSVTWSSLHERIASGLARVLCCDSSRRTVIC